MTDGWDEDVGVTVLSILSILVKCRRGWVNAGEREPGCPLALASPGPWHHDALRRDVSRRSADRAGGRRNVSW